MPRISDWFLRLAVIAALIGMVMGVAMGATENFTLSPVHAHINLLGWTSMLLYGIFYRLFPAAGVARVAAIHFGLVVTGLVLMLPGLAMKLTGTGHAVSTPLLSAGSILTLLSMVVFAFIVFRATSSAAQASVSNAAATAGSTL